MDSLARRAREDPGFRLPATLSYWTFSDIMNEVNENTQLGYGLCYTPVHCQYTASSQHVLT